ncbi:MAG: hypothetical protein LUG85_08810 [Clostridiales bacterium]|nr:hypothetical protein [Clostridiales bacterium]
MAKRKKQEREINIPEKDKKNKRQKSRKNHAAAPSHTKGYYRFSRQFPSLTDSGGYRDNTVFINSPDTKKRRRWKYAALFAVVFIISFAAAATCFSISKLPPEEESTLASEETAAETAQGSAAVYLSGEVLSYSSVESLAQSLSLQGFDSVIIEFKDASGYIYFTPQTSVSDEALTKASSDAAEVVSDFQELGFKVYAAFSCFADDIYARNNSDAAAFIMTEEGSGSLTSVKTLWYDTSADSHAWVSPYSYIVMEYLEDLLTETANTGVDGIILTGVVLPEGTDQADLLFDTRSDDDETTVNEQMAAFVSSVISDLTCEIGVEISAENIAAASVSGQIPDIFLTGCDYLAADMRLSLLPDNTVLGDNTYIIPSDSPYEFTSALTDVILDFMTENECSFEILPILEQTDNLAKQLSALNEKGIYSYAVYEENGE